LLYVITAAATMSWKQYTSNWLLEIQRQQVN